MNNNILLFSTSSRNGSYNTLVVKLMASLIKGANANIISLSDYKMPIYDSEIESDTGVPTDALKLTKVFKSSDGIIVSTAEYNSSYPPIVKNAIDWVSRVDSKCFLHKPVLVVSASPSPLGGINGALMLKNLFMVLGGLVVPSRFFIPSAHNAFDVDGSLNSSELQTGLVALLDSFMHIMQSLSKNQVS